MRGVQQPLDGLQHPLIHQQRDQVLVGAAALEQLNGVEAEDGDLPVGRGAGEALGVPLGLGRGVLGRGLPPQVIGGLRSGVRGVPEDGPAMGTSGA